ncbi:hypothetical protein [Priestia koreensis]|uniref:Uncharacterized protein n=1 Tax=Priestia koreensis TaxID=284581 RepID=A0A0M0LIS1_9BACI|nr:hypothetical protein [Priestia koreensis]KOO50822.1 hypothetical protein AMD01_03555 [Priestia koreensis]
MTQPQLLKLRKFQFLFMNAIIAVLFLLLFSLIHIGIGMRNFFILMSLLMIAQTMLLLFDKRPLIYRLSKNMAKLLEYEKEKLGNEWRKQQKSQIIASVMVAIMFMMNANLMDNRQLFTGFGDVWEYILFFVFMLGIVNIPLYYHVKKVDRQSTEELQGYTKSMYISSLVTAIICFFTVALITAIISNFL